MGIKKEKQLKIDNPSREFSKNLTRAGRFGSSKIIIKGKVKKILTKKLEIKAVETIIGIGLINSPIIPLDKSRGKKAQTVVIVVVKTGIKKSRQTISAASTAAVPFLR